LTAKGAIAIKKGGHAHTIGLVQTFDAYNNGDYLLASQAGGATLGGIGGSEFGSFLGGFGGPAAPVTVPLFAVIGGLAGAYGGANLFGSVYNNGFGPLDHLSTPPPPFPY
jgi:hypothetical protein